MRPENGQVPNIKGFTGQSMVFVFYSNLTEFYSSGDKKKKKKSIQPASRVAISGPGSVED